MGAKPGGTNGPVIVPPIRSRAEAPVPDHITATEHSPRRRIMAIHRRVQECREILGKVSDQILPRQTLILSIKV